MFKKPKQQVSIRNQTLVELNLMFAACEIEKDIDGDKLRWFFLTKPLCGGFNV